MKKTLILASMAALALVSCNKMESPSQAQNEMSFIPMAGNNDIATRGYSEDNVFYYTPFMNLHTAGVVGDEGTISRDMHISAYQHPQNGSAGNYFVDNIFSQMGSTGVWGNYVNKVHTPVYWPIGCTLDFLAYSVAEEVKATATTSTAMENHDHIKVVWDANNAASQVVLDVPGESSQDDILFASSSNRLSEKGHQSVAMKFKHAQAWLEFAFYGGGAENYPVSLNPAPDDGTGTCSEQKAIYVTKIVLDDVYNAGKLTIDNNLGNAIANWDFSAETKKDIVVDDNWDNYGKKTFITNNSGEIETPLRNDVDKCAYFDMLIPEQKKTSFTIYYKLPGIVEEQSYHFTTDQKTWLMGEKYIYTIAISTHEITVTPTVQVWHNGGVDDVRLEGGYNGNNPTGGSR